MRKNENENENFKFIQGASNNQNRHKRYPEPSHPSHCTDPHANA